MTLERKHAWLLLAVAAWNVVIWLTFAKNLSAAHAAGEDHPTGYWVAHTILIIVDLVIAVVLARLGWKLLRTNIDPRHGPPSRTGVGGSTREPGAP